MNTRILSQLSESDTDFLIGRSSHETQFEDKADTADEETTLFDANSSIQVKDSQVNPHTLEKNVTNKIQKEVDKVMTSVESRVQGAVLTAMENLLIPRRELAIESAKAS